MEKPAENPTIKKPRVRSPAYPSMSLSDAIEQARIIYAKEGQGRHPVPITAVAKDWEYASVNGSVLTAVSALKQFGIFEEVADKEPRELKLTSHALNMIVRSEGDPERIESVKKCAMLPKLYGRLWAKYGWPLPSEESIKTYLELQEHYSSKFISSIIKDYKSTILFAKLEALDKIVKENESDEEEKAEPIVAKIGDFVQWESQGMLQFPEPKKVVAISDDGTHLRVEGSMTGIPIEQTRVEKPPAIPPSEIPSHLKTPPRPTGYVPPIFSQFGGQQKQDVFTTENGEVIVRWPMELSEDDFNDLSGWLDMLKRKIQRSVRSDDPNSSYGPAKIEMNPR